MSGHVDNLIRRLLIYSASLGVNVYGGEGPSFTPDGHVVAGRYNPETGTLIYVDNGDLAGEDKCALLIHELAHAVSTPVGTTLETDPSRRDFIERVTNGAAEIVCEQLAIDYPSEAKRRRWALYEPFANLSVDEQSNALDVAMRFAEGLPAVQIPFDGWARWAFSE